MCWRKWGGSDRRSTTSVWTSGPGATPHNPQPPTEPASTSGNLWSPPSDPTLLLNLHKRELLITLCRHRIRPPKASGCSQPPSATDHHLEQPPITNHKPPDPYILILQASRTTRRPSAGVLDWPLPTPVRRHQPPPGTTTNRQPPTSRAPFLSVFRRHRVRPAGQARVCDGQAVVSHL